MENAAIGVALSRRLYGTPFTALPEKTILYEKASLTLNMVLDAVPEVLSSHTRQKKTSIEIQHKGQVYKARLISPALSTEIDLETARQLEFVSSVFSLSGSLRRCFDSRHTQYGFGR